MKHLVLAVICVICTVNVWAQNAGDEPPSKDEVILYLRTMRSHDMMQRMMEVQGQSMQNLFRDMITREKGQVPPDFDTEFKKAMDDLIKGMPIDQVMEAMIPAYQKHFTKGDIAAMNAFYSSPVGQKVLQELPAVLQEGNQAAMPILSKYMTDWKEKMQHQFEQMKSGPSIKAPAAEGPDIKR
jgi:hypothetical protein